MKQKIIAANVCLTFLLSATAWSSPKPVQPPLKAHTTSLDEINVATDDGGHGGGYGGRSESWTLRADDTARHPKTYSASEMAQGSNDISDAVGVMEPGAFNRMLDYLQWTRLLDLKVPKPNSGEEQSGLTVTLVRGGKSKSVRITDSAPFSDAVTWTTLTLVDALTRNVVWKTSAQFKAGTGLAVLYQIDDTLSKTEVEQAKVFPRPLFSVLNATGQEVTVLRPNTDKERAAFLTPAPSYTDSWVTSEMISSFFTLTPGKYHLVFKKLEGVAPIRTEGFAWRVIGDETGNSAIPRVQVIPGQLSFVVIRLEKKHASKG